MLGIYPFSLMTSGKPQCESFKDRNPNYNS